MQLGIGTSLVQGAAVAALAAYAYAARREAARGGYWSPWRTASFSGGIALIVLALFPPVVAFAHHDLRGHMVQHLLLGMLAPLGLVLAAPMTLLLRSLTPAAARGVVFVLRSGFVRVISHPLVALIFNVGGMYLLYTTPLYAATLTDPLLHIWVHLHFVIAGCLFTWSIAGPDPAPRRPSLRYRLAVLFIAIATHSILAKLMYAFGWPTGGPHDLEQIRAAAKIMYYGGDFTELLLAVALMSSWYRAQSGREQRVVGQSQPDWL